MALYGCYRYQKGGALWLLNSVWFGKGHFARKWQEAFYGWSEKSKKELMCRHLASQTPKLTFHIQV